MSNSAHATGSTYPTTSETRRPSRALNVTLWVFQALTGAFFVFASAAPKLVGHSSATEIWDQIGLPTWMMYGVGTLELLGGVALVVPILSSLAGLSFIALMVGAFITQATVFDGKNIATPMIITVIMGFIAWGRRDRLGDLPALVRRRP